jgi:hypothetical protein
MQRCKNTDCLKLINISDDAEHLITCDQCGDFFCSQECFKNFSIIHKKKCIRITHRAFLGVLKDLGYDTSSQIQLYNIKGRGYFMFPGPISEPFHPKMIPITDLKKASLITESEFNSIKKRDAYYMVYDENIFKLFANELTFEQKLMLGKMMHKGEKESVILTTI